MTFRLPGPLAVTVAQVDQMSGGRVELGLGTGWFDAEHAAYGIPFPPLAERFGMLGEQLAIITGLWQTPERAEVRLPRRAFQVTDSPGLPKPAQRPRPPVLIGGPGPPHPRLAAAYADEFNLGFRSVPDSAAAFGRVRAACAAAGRDAASLRYSVAHTVCCGRDTAELERRAAAMGRRLAELRGERGGRDARRGDRPDRAVRRGRGGRVYLQVLDLDDIDHLELVAAEVLPQVT